MNAPPTEARVIVPVVEAQNMEMVPHDALPISGNRPV